MRVLWFTNVPLLPVARRIGSPDPVSGGWMDGLRAALQGCPDLALGVASASENDYDEIEQDGTRFYNIHSSTQHGNLASIYRRWFPRIDWTEDLGKYLDVIKRFGPDVIHIHGSEGPYGILARETSIPTVLSLQGILTICEKFYFGGLTCNDKLRDAFSMEFLRGIDTIHQHRRLKQMALRERQILKTCNNFIGRTEFDKNFTRLINPDATYYHCDEILRAPFYSGGWSSAFRDKAIIYCTAGPAPFKGLDFLFQAGSILKSNGVQNIELRIAGAIRNSPIWHILRKKIQRLHLMENVVWLGVVHPARIVAELETAHAFVLPSYVENSPNSLAEAMLVGTPSIASNAGGISSLVTHGRDGLLFPPGDAYSLAGLIMRLLREPALARSLSEEARKTAHVRHDPPKIAEQMMKIYAAILNTCACESL